MNRSTRILRGSAAVLLLFTVWIVWDIETPFRHDLRNFDPQEVARLETAMWRSYYEHRPLSLFLELSETLRRQYGMRFWQATAGAYYAARAAIVFQKGTGRSEYQRALPALENFYTFIRRGSTTDFDVHRAAALELEWWIVHREWARYPEGALERALANLQAEIYRLPGGTFAAHARARAQAMRIRDSRATLMGEGDWNSIRDLLDRSWSSLHQALAFADAPALSYTK